MHWKRERDPVDSVLRSAAPRPSDDLVAGLSDRVLATAPKRAGRGSRTAFAAALAVFMLGTFASFGGLGYAASGAQSASEVVKRVVAPAKVQKQAKRTAAAGQYGEQAVPQPEPQAVVFVIKIDGAVPHSPRGAVQEERGQQERPHNTERASG